MSDVAQKKSRRSMIMVLGAFILPIVLAKLALTQNWLEYGVTNKGTLVENELTLQKLGLEEASIQQTWLVIYSLPAKCDAHCEQTLLSVNTDQLTLENNKIKWIEDRGGVRSAPQPNNIIEKSNTSDTLDLLINNNIPNNIINLNQKK